MATAAIAYEYYKDVQETVLKHLESSRKTVLFTAPVTGRALLSAARSAALMTPCAHPSVRLGQFTEHGFPAHEDPGIGFPVCCGPLPEALTAAMAQQDPAFD